MAGISPPNRWQKYEDKLERQRDLEIKSKKRCGIQIKVLSLRKKKGEQYGHK
jgi:hypothetical protein